MDIEFGHRITRLKPQNRTWAKHKTLRGDRDHRRDSRTILASGLFGSRTIVSFSAAGFDRACIATPAVLIIWQATAGRDERPWAGYPITFRATSMIAPIPGAPSNALIPDFLSIVVIAPAHS
jgi:hypothetical protein